ncbi:hypothetical protein F5Y19DRAFT_246207 [Xylariaceae sp. FL1651]|nr:hypothetical protein F5Y19DRAFT_246207 [Xylariaceae sp. FL1651]
MVSQTHHPVKRKVKTGCRTCKIRHVKCDEGRPVCHRCVSTGRVCDGYGIWGSGGSIYTNRSMTKRSSSDNVKYNLPSHFGKMSPEQESYFRWFRYRTYTKLPLPFISPFWHTLVFQACAVEPAVLHAVMALGSAHQQESLEGSNARRYCMTLDARQKFMLREYTEAIRSLQRFY